jgi:ABC-type uncharacterized transport system permease subunit
MIFFFCGLASFAPPNVLFLFVWLSFILLAFQLISTFFHVSNYFSDKNSNDEGK